MTRFSAAAVILGWLAFFSSFPAIAQSDPSQCFPWQEFKNGSCVAKPSQAPPPLPPPAAALPDPCFDGKRSLSSQCTCPINAHMEGGRCTADAVAPPAIQAAPVAVAPPVPPPLPPPLPPATRKADEPLLCDGGSASGGRCVCPAGYIVMPPRGGGGGGGGTCVRTDASNCQGGELTVSGACMCNGQVVMSGETYLLEYTNGKCLPKRCPVSTEMRDGKCSSVSAVAPASTPEPEPKAKPKETKDADEGEHHHGCGRGMVRTHSGTCVVARRRMPAMAPPPGFDQYYRNYQFPGNSPSSTPQN
ncbi:MAG TPA: hypothetical protein VGH70_12845 [Bradyrhizobium sp.]